MLIIDIRDRLCSVGNRNSQLDLCNRTDQSAPKLVPLPRPQTQSFYVVSSILKF